MSYYIEDIKNIFSTADKTAKLYEHNAQFYDC